jgi:hypothetical protein
LTTQAPPLRRDTFGGGRYDEVE